jgi:hypothetical protein
MQKKKQELSEFDDDSVIADAISDYFYKLYDKRASNLQKKKEEKEESEYFDEIKNKRKARYEALKEKYKD